MKEKILLFIIGILVGAVIATGVFYVYTTSNSCDCGSNNTMISGGNPPDMPSGQNGGPPEMPSGEMKQPPEMSNGQNSN